MYLFLALEVMGFDLLTPAILIDIFLIPFKAEDDIARPSHLHNIDLILQNPLFLCEILKPKETLLITIINIYLVSSSGSLDLSDVFFIKDFIRLLIIII